MVYRDDPPDYVRPKVEFHLVYSGNLLKGAGTNKRSYEKHSIRRQLHAQLKRLWETHPALKEYAAKTVERDDDGNILVSPKPFLDYLADGYATGGVRFIPLITEPNGLICSLDILLLRPEAPGTILHSAGDIDNRIKTLIDALRIPAHPQEIKSRPNDEPDPNPMYCLLQDDKLITTLRVKTDRLLLPEVASVRDAVLVIHVETTQMDPFGSPWELHL